MKYSAQPYLPQPAELKPGPFIVYLDVWERFLTYIEDEDRTTAELRQSIREVALGGPDTAARSEVVWQVRLLAASGTATGAAPPNNSAENFSAFQDQLLKAGIVRATPGKIKARARKPQGQ